MAFSPNLASYVVLDFVGFGVQVIAVSASGVPAPSPLFFTNLLYGTRHGITSGLEAAYGHTVVKLPLVVLLAAGPSSAAITSQYVGITGLVGGIAILFVLRIWMDYAWLTATAYLSSQGSLVFKSRYYPLLLLALAAVLVYLDQYICFMS
jgi:hypothetical protein